MNNKLIKFEPVKREDGTSEFQDFLMSLPVKDGEKLLALIDTVEELGIQEAIKMQWAKKIDTNLFELRSKQGSNIQRGMYFHFENNRYFITHGFTKKTDKTPLREKKVKR
ncbi:MAG: type II toxin-antitoxin system RelE/ParE family toxin [Lachnospiraceae bacterium]|jgi:phage-related protein|nr:type II toxin-antitoxin system RelE/ParE family toxin [Lachnospiraceae bacterium]